MPAEVLVASEIAGVSFRRRSFLHRPGPSRSGQTLSYRWPATVACRSWLDS